MQVDTRLPPHPAPKRHGAGLFPERARPGALLRARVRGGRLQLPTASFRLSTIVVIVVPDK